MKIAKRIWWPCRFAGCGYRWHKADTIYFPPTAYNWNGKGLDPNGPWLVCKDAAKEMDDYWNDMWANYYGSF